MEKIALLLHGDRCRCELCERWFKARHEKRHSPRKNRLRIDSSTRRKVLERDGRCVACGDTQNLTVDHIVPVGRAGSDELHNLQALCFDCNQLKGNLSMEVFLGFAKERTT